MGRPKTFDDDKVLDEVVGCFRANGFKSTSIRDLEAATGLKAASMYKAFGNKNELFSRALMRYRTEVLDRRVATYLNSDRGVEGIVDFFTSTYHVEPLPHLGCLIATSAVEASQLDLAGRQQINSGLASIRVGLRDHLERCQSRGEIAPTIDRDTISTALLMLYEGLLVLLRSGADPAAFETTLRLTITSMLRPTTNTDQRNDQ